MELVEGRRGVATSIRPKNEQICRQSNENARKYPLFLEKAETIRESICTIHLSNN